MLLLLSGVGEGGTATRVGRRKDLVGEESVLTDNIPIGANEAPSLGLLGEESLLDLILQNSDMFNKVAKFFLHLGEALGLRWLG